MRALFTPAFAIAIAVGMQVALPDRDVWHAGWYSVLVAALAVWLVVAARRAAGAARTMAAPILIAAGCFVLAVAGIASGLLAPDPQLVVAPPGATVAVGGVGALVFPPLHAPAGPALQRSGRPPVPIGSRRYVGAFLLRAVPRTVVEVNAADATGAHLTVTQPTGTAFSSPVLLMDQTQRISGLDLPFDSFSLPAAHRIVKVVLFDAAQVALMHGIQGPPQPIVLFAVDDDTDRPLPHAIEMARDGQTIAIAGVRLQPHIATYPAVDVLSVPPVYALAAAAALILAGIALGALGARTPSRS